MFQLHTVLQHSLCVGVGVIHCAAVCYFAMSNVLTPYLLADLGWVYL